MVHYRSNRIPRCGGCLQIMDILKSCLEDKTNVSKSQYARKQRLFA
jgi:hypothetical protein